ncbi:hypothetical protein D3C72_1418900 [compost metagenome]
MLRAVVGKQVDHEAVPAVFTRRFFNRQDHLYREGGCRGIQRQHAEGLNPTAVAANASRRKIGHVFQLVDRQFDALVGIRPQLIGLVDGAGYRHQGYPGKFCNVFQRGHAPFSIWDKCGIEVEIIPQLSAGL